MLSDFGLQQARGLASRARQYASCMPATARGRPTGRPRVMFCVVLRGTCASGDVIGAEVRVVSLPECLREEGARGGLVVTCEGATSRQTGRGPGVLDVGHQVEPVAGGGGHVRVDARIVGGCLLPVAPGDHRAGGEGGYGVICPGRLVSTLPSCPIIQSPHYPKQPP